MFAGGLAFMTAGALTSIFGTRSGVALTSPHSLCALSSEEVVHLRFRTPVVSIWLTGALVVVLAVTGTFVQLILLNVAARLYQYLMVCASVAVLRYRNPDAECPFRLPLGPVLPVLALNHSVDRNHDHNKSQVIRSYTSSPCRSVRYP